MSDFKLYMHTRHKTWAVHFKRGDAWATKAVPKPITAAAARPPSHSSIDTRSRRARTSSRCSAPSCVTA